MEVAPLSLKLPYNRDMPTKQGKAKTMPMEIDAESVLNATLTRFRERVAFRMPVTDDDIDFLEKAMQAYAALKYNAEGKEGPMSAFVSRLIEGPPKNQK